MKSEEIVNKETQEVLTSKAGVPLVRNTLELGDKFISLYNNPVSELRGDAVHPRLYTKAKVLSGDSEQEVFLELTPTQFKVLEKVAKDENADDLNQYVFNTYEYENCKKTISIGITHKTKKEPVGFN